MTAKQKAARENFKKVVAEAKKLRAKNKNLTQAQAVKQAWAIYYNKAEKLGTAKPDKKVGALPIDFKGNFLGFRFRIIYQYQLDGKVTAQIVELAEPGDIIAELYGDNSSEETAAINLMRFAWKAYTNNSPLLSRNETKNLVQFDKTAKLVFSKVKKFVVGLSGEVKKYNSGKDKGKRKSKGLKIEVAPEVKKLAVIDQIKSILADNKKILPGGYTLKPGKIRSVKVSGTKVTPGSLVSLSGIKYRQTPEIVVAGIGKREQLSHLIPEVKVRVTRGKRSGTEMITKVEDSVEVFRKWIGKNKVETQELLCVMFLNQGNRVLGVYSHSVGSINATSADIRLIMASALKMAAVSMIICHNHPSGNLNPSQADLDVTRNLDKACKFHSINLLDHIILTKNGYYSFAEGGRI